MDNLIVATSASVGQVVGTAVTFPLDVAKTRMQTALGKGKKTTFDALKEAFLEDGIVGTIKMFPPKGIAQGATRFSYYYFYSWLGTAYKTRYGRPGMFANLMIGYLAGLLNTGILNPFETISNMVISDRSLSVSDALAVATKEDGWGGLFRGWESTFVVSMNPAIQNTVYDQIKALLLRGRKSGLGYWQSFWLGALAKAVATVSTYPVQRAKMIVQCDREEKEAKPLITTLREIMAKDGASGLFKGLKPSLYKGVLQSAFMLMVKEQIERVTRTAIKALAEGKAVECV